MNCPICGFPMVHHRLRGYQCWQEEHNQQRHMQIAQAIMRPDFDDAYTWCIGNPESGFHAHSHQNRGWMGTLCGSIVTTDSPLERVYRRPTCEKCVELLLEVNSRIGE